MDEYEVESIVDMDSSKKDNRNFLIKYIGYPEAELENETNLIGCKELINEFLDKHRATGDKKKDWRPMDLEEEEPDNDENEPPTNMITTYRVLQYIKTLRRSRPNINQTLPIQQLAIEPTNKEQIYITLVDNHFLVIYDNPKENEIAICDGANESRKQASNIKKQMNRKRARVISFTDQIGDDHCGSSAILITLELLRLKNKLEDANEWPNQISTSKGLRNNLIKKLHRHKTGAQNKARTLPEKKKATKCEKCNKQYKNRIQLNNHQRACLRQ